MSGHIVLNDRAIKARRERMGIRETPYSHELIHFHNIMNPSAFEDASVLPSLKPG